MDKFMDSPWFLRFTALILAIVLFISVQAEEGSQSAKTVGNQVDIIHEVPVEVYYDDKNLVVTGVPETVNITIEGPINIVQTTKLLKDFTLFVDLRSLTMGEHHVKIQDENISDKLQVRIDPSTIDVLIEERITQTFRVDPEYNQRLLAESFNVVNMEVKPATIEVTGAKSIVDSISFVKATVSGEEGMNKTFEEQAQVRVLDRDLNKLNVTVVPEQVMVKVEVAENSKEVPIVLKAQGTPPSTVVIDELTSETKVVTIYGPGRILEDIEQVTVDVDVSKIKGQDTQSIELKKPKGVTSISMEKVKVTIKATSTEADAEAEADPEDKDKEVTDDKVTEDVSTEPPQPSKFLETIKFENLEIAVIGLDKKFKSTLLKPVSGLITLTITGQSNVIKMLTKSDFTLLVDASGIDDEGEITLPVSVNGPPNIDRAMSVEEVTLKIELA